MKRINKEEIYKELSLEDLVVEIDGIDVCEEWKDIDWIEGLQKGCYRVSNLGRIKSLSRFIGRKSKTEILSKERISKQHPDRDGYVRVALIHTSIRFNRIVSRLVSVAFIENQQNKPCSCHKDDIVHHNWVGNLFWGTHKDNSDDKVLKQRNVFGIRQRSAKIDPDTVKKVRTLFTEGKKTLEIAQLLNISKDIVSSIKRGKTWKQVV